MEQQQRLEIGPDELYALIGQLTVENRLLRGMLARARQEMASGPPPGAEVASSAEAGGAAPP